MTRTTALLALAVAGLTACGGDKVTNPPDTSSFAFTYAGAASGSFNVTGTATDLGASGVTGFIDSGVAFVMAAKQNTTAGPQIAVLGFTQGATGSLAFAGAESEDSLCQAGAACAVMVFIVSAMVDGSLHPFTCTLASGSLTLTASTTTHSAGTFSGAGTCVDAMDESEDPTGAAITVTGGSYTTTYGANPLGGMGLALR